MKIFNYLIYFDNLIVFLSLRNKFKSMIKVTVKEKEDINRALKRFKKI